jgi:hypothetical protein
MQRKRLVMVKGAHAPSFRDSPVPTILLQGEPFLSEKAEVMRKLRERGIYSLSDGREFVAHAVFRGGYVFYTPEDWKVFGPYAYESTADGHLRWNDQHEQWRAEDLIDTRRTAPSRSRDE